MLVRDVQSRFDVVCQMVHSGLKKCKQSECEGRNMLGEDELGRKKTKQLASFIFLRKLPR